MDEPRTTIDLKRLAAEVSVQHGIRVDPDDPMMAVVTLNRLVFEQAVAQVLERVQAVGQRFRNGGGQGPGSRWWRPRARGPRLRPDVRQEVGKALEDFRRVGPDAGSNTAGRRTTLGEQRWFAIGMLLSLALFAVGVWAGTALR